MSSFSFSLSNSTCLCPFIVVLGGIKYRSAAPRHDMTPQIIWLGGSFIVVATYFLSKRLPNDRVMCMWQGTNCCMVHSSENTFFHSATVRWDVSPNSLLRGLETVLKRIVVPFKRKIARFSCKSSLARVLLSVSLSVLPKT